jgi:hypothetical protein
VLEDGVAVETRAAFQHHKPEAAAVLIFHKIHQWLFLLLEGQKTKRLLLARSR